MMHALLPASYKSIYGHTRVILDRPVLLSQRKSRRVFDVGFFFFLFFVPADTRNTDILGEPGRSGREFARRGALEIRGLRRQFRSGQSPDGTPEETARLPGVSGVRHPLG